MNANDALKVLSKLALAAVVATSAATTGCVAGDVEDDELAEMDADEGEGEGDGEGEIAETDQALRAGVNGKACLFSPYNCKFRVKGGNRVAYAGKNLAWPVGDGEVVDGNGHLLAFSTWDHLKFNYGQVRKINGVQHALALSTESRSAGWFPVHAIGNDDAFRGRVGNVDAKDTGGARLGCYQIKNSVDEALVVKKVVYDEKSKFGRAGDYLPLERANGGRYANLAFNIPGFGLGGPAVDIFPSGTRFQRVDVPTDHGRPSLDVPLYVKDSAGRYRRRSGSLKFIYGYVDSELGERRFGWMALPALLKSTGCK